MKCKNFFCGIIFFRNFAIGNQFLISLDSMAGKKGVRLPLTRATETPGSLHDRTQ